MRMVVQRVSSARVRIAGEEVGAIGPGVVVLLGIAATDTLQQVAWSVGKLADLRIFDDAQGKLNRALREVGGSALVISNFTTLGDCRKGRRPSYHEAAPPDQALPLYEAFLTGLGAQGIPVASGRFGALMEVEINNSGPVTLVVDSPADRFEKTSTE